MGVSTLALVGATGGAGTTTVAVELAATLSRAGRSVAVVDAAFATQGLSTYVSGRIDGDVTAVATGEVSTEEAVYDLEFETSGEALAVPAHASFERLARAKAPEHAQRFESLVTDLTDRVDHVLVDVPPVAANQAVAAVTAAARRALVVPATRRGADLFPRQQGRLRDLGAPADTVVATRTDADGAVDVADADHDLPVATGDPLQPSSLDPETDLAPAAADLAEETLAVSLGLEFPDGGWL
ncbi:MULTISPECIES: ParA family protein [Haloarcula]|uniref:ParA family protein n=1 Tax=Haloarcula TaxID=2237 RepID=UPI0023EB8C28|nr:AAA family ATPase [Halomicroarcula sp. XH51]